MQVYKVCKITKIFPLQNVISLPVNIEGYERNYAYDSGDDCAGGQGAYQAENYAGKPDKACL